VLRVQPNFRSNLLATRLSKLANLNEHELGILSAIEGKPKYSFPENSRILNEGHEINAAYVIISGWAYLHRTLADGRRQLLKVVLPGDAIGLCSRSRPLALTTAVALTPVKTVEAGELLAAWSEDGRTPGIANALEMSAAEDEYYLLCHAARLGRQTAYERMAHLLCELEYRLASRGLSSGGVFLLPMTQEVLADVLGLSVVHVNRTLQQMRRENKIEFNRGKVSMLDLNGLLNAGEFTPPKVSAHAVAG
jgi:CRP-like cAMP-binding protein